MTLAFTRLPRRAIAALLTIGLVASVGLWVVVDNVTAASTCVTRIAGTYYKPADFLITLDKSGSVIGQYSQSVQDLIGAGETFDGRWTCSGNQVTIQQFKFTVDGAERQVERGNATGTFDGKKTITLTFAFHVFPETATAADLRSAEGTVVNVPALDVKRVSTP